MQLQKLISEKLKLESRWAQQALEQGRVTTDMKWIDIKIKELRNKYSYKVNEEVLKSINN